MMTISEGVLAVREKMAAAAARAGVDAGSVMLVAAAKMNDSARVREAIAAGVDAVGENRVQELTVKNAEGAYAGAPLHFIGHLQRNKVRFVVGTADLIQSVGSPELLEAISKRATSLGIVQPVLLEVNVGYEEAKSGVFPEALDELAAYAGTLNGVSVHGLMTVPPASPENEVKSPHFERMYKLFVDIKQKKYDNVFMEYLSMGMSGDYCAAIESGANMIRVGSAIFGPRY